jgi:D-alanyl-D-alanine dipeptidase
LSCEQQPIEETKREIVADPPASKDTAVVIAPADWNEVKSDSGLILRMAYADTNNFTHEQIYPCPKCYLRPEVNKALIAAGKLALSKNLNLIIFDCYRPKQYQQKMYDIVKNPDYVALPVKGSMHNKGLAVDIALSKEGKLLDFGSEFDDFSVKAHYSAKGISATARKNRALLRSIMIKAGFAPYENEWWHFNYSTVKYPADDFIWNCE